MPVSVTQPTSVKVSSEVGDVISVSVVSGGSETVYVSSNVTTNNVEVVGVIGGGGGASGGTDITLEQAITISNGDAAFSHMTSPIAAGTSIEAVLRDMLIKYNVTTISLTNIDRALQGTDGNYGSFSTVTSGATLEMGRGLKVQGFDYNIADNSQTTDDSVSFLNGSTAIETGFSDDNAAKTLASVFELDPSTETTAQFKVKAIDSGSGSNTSIGSGSINFSWKFRVKVGSSSTETISDATEAGTLFSGMSAASNALRSEADFDVTADSGMDTAGNYTWIAYPASFGNLNKINLAGTDVLSDFESPVDYNITNDYSITTSYRFYRSTYDNAFATGQVLTIDF